MPDAKKGPGDDPRPSDQEASLPPASEDTVPRLLAEGNPTPSPEPTRAIPPPPDLDDLLSEVDKYEPEPLDWQLVPIFTWTTPDGEVTQHPPKRWPSWTGSVADALVDGAGRRAHGIGLLLGPSGVVDIDLDCLEAQELAERFLRSTATFGRKGKTTHYLYRTDPHPHPDNDGPEDQPKTRKFQNPNGQKKKTILELRRGPGYQTVIPPTMKLDGHPPEWREGPEKIKDWEDGDEERVENLALAVLIAPELEIEGNRHTAALAWAGELAKRGVTEKRAMKVILEVCDYWGDEELDDREQCVRSTYKKPKKDVRGISDKETHKTLDAILGHRAKLGARTVNVKQGLDVVIQQMNDVLDADDAPAIFRAGGYTTADGGSDLDRLAVELARKIEFAKPSGRGGYHVVHPSAELVRRWASAPDDRIPELRGVWSAPLLRPDGSVRTDRGYDPKTKVFCEGWAGREPGTTKEEAEAAAKSLLDFVDADQWQEDIDKCAWLAHVLTVAARPVIGGNVPVWVYSASYTGAGKTTLARAAGKIGGRCDALTEPSLKDEELPRRLHAHALKPAIVLDNLRDPLSSAVLEGTITSGILSVRVMYVGPRQIPWRTVLSVTSNKAKTGRDWIRRVIPVRLKPGELDSGREVLDEITPEHTRDAITIVRAWLSSEEYEVVRARPQESKAESLRSFAEWSRVIAGALVWLGYADVVAETREHVEELAEDNGTGILDAIEALMALMGKEAVSAQDLLDAIKPTAAFGDQECAQLLREAFGGIQSPRSLGQRLRDLHDGTRAMDNRKTNGTWVWSVFQIGSGS